MQQLDVSQITNYTIGNTVATATPVQVKGKCVFQFDGSLQIMLERNSPATQQFTMIGAVGVTPPNIVDFGPFGRTIYCYFPAGAATLQMWINTNGVN